MAGSFFHSRIDDAVFEHERDVFYNSEARYPQFIKPAFHQAVEKLPIKFSLFSVTRVSMCQVYCEGTILMAPAVRCQGGQAIARCAAPV